MNDIQFGLDKLGDLVGAAEGAATVFEKAAVFAAASVLLDQIESKAMEINTHFVENVQRVRGHLSAALGFDVANGHEKEMHFSWAGSDLMNLKRQFSQVN